MLETSRSRGATGAEPANPARGALPPYHARQQRSLHRANSTRTIADAVTAIDGSLHSAARQQSQRGINQLNQSFPLNGGLGNNPTNRDAYIRYNLNR